MLDDELSQCSRQEFQVNLDETNGDEQLQDDYRNDYNEESDSDGGNQQQQQ